jgi:hypothetical protein
VDRGYHDAVRARLKEWTRLDEGLQKKLDYFTFGETQALLEHLCTGSNKPFSQLHEVMHETGVDRDYFRQRVETWYKELITLRETTSENSVRAQLTKDKGASRLQ